MEKVVKQMQGQFSEEDWYYLRKIHKKEHNFFLEKGGQRGSSGGGWLSHKTKSTIKSQSQVSDDEILKRGSPSTLNEENKTSSVSSRVKLAKRKRFPSGNNNELEQKSVDTFDMIDEEDPEDEDAEQYKQHKLIMSLGAIREREHSASCSDENQSMQADPEQDWTRVKRRRKQHIELKDLTEENFLSLIDSKNQDKRFYGWLNF